MGKPGIRPRVSNSRKKISLTTTYAELEGKFLFSTNYVYNFKSKFILFVISFILILSFNYNYAFWWLSYTYIFIIHVLWAKFYVDNVFGISKKMHI